MPSIRPDHQRYRPEAMNESGFAVNAVAATLFLGLVLTIVVYSALDLTGTLTRMGRFGPVLPLIVIAWLMVGIYMGVKRLKRRAAKIRIKGPLFMRSLMNDCIERTCGVLQRQLNTPEIPSAGILNDILMDKMLYICNADCQRFSDIRRRIEGSRLKGSPGLELARFFQTDVEYGKQPLPDEIRQVADTVSRSRTDLRDLLERLKNAHQTLCTGTGNILALLPPDPKKVETIRNTYRYRPPTPQRARRMVFAIETLTYLKATRYENVNPMDRRRYDSVAEQVIPELAKALTVYKQAWQDLVDAYERPRGQRAG
ncbi:WXG100 family type VII secretion target [Desulfosarcina alkanivorans]|nr:hypothetical protein [Desulfosarcina alkanivorans]